MRFAKFGYRLSLLAACGLLLPAPAWAEDVAGPPGRTAGDRTLDVMLDANGTLSGTVVDPQNQPVAGATIWLAAGGDQRASALSDRAGEFRFTALRGGIFRIATGDQTTLCRVWTATAAPPGARPSVLLVLGGGEPVATRGQTPIPSYFRSDAFLIGAVIAGAIAIPIAIHNFRNDQPSGS
ncbi:MAG TPA: carboxypeptidase-like regulatory domain-containing protein [Pirellulales bacterium]|nr:carboxypeptidase-like regulatory domain-containing protein [Pirellulales bacterium]